MDNQIQNNQNNQIEQKPKFNREAYIKNYMRGYMRDRYHRELIECDCGCKVHPSRMESHKATRKHKYLVLTKNQEQL